MDEKSKNVCLSTLKNRGWTVRLIEELLPEPILRRNPHYSSASEMKLWNFDDVKEAENNEIFKNHLKSKKERAEKRRENKKKKLENLINFLPQNPAEAYPLARNIKRHFILNVGGTNTGKTFTALQSLAKSQNGIYLAPLRLLAMEIQDTLLEQNVKCSLITGEEERIIENSSVVSSTVEKLDINSRYDMAVIDECQLLEDKERGGAWTRAILGVAADDIWLCLSENALSACIKLIEMCGDTYEINRYERKTPLLFDGVVSMKKIKPYDAIVVFSRKEVLTMAQRLNKKGYSVSAIYGALPYSSRKEQVRKYNEGETNVIVATDAIGMGLNLPIERVVFGADAKYDGESFRKLIGTEVKQISGRAGRFGKFEKGYVGILGEVSSKVIQDGLYSPDVEVKEIRLSFPESLIGYNEKHLSKIMKSWKEIEYPNQLIQSNIDPIIERVIFLEKNYPEISKETAYRLATVMFDNEKYDLFQKWSLYCYWYLSGDLSRFALPNGDLSNLQSCENSAKQIDLYYSFAKAIGADVDLYKIEQKRTEISNKINDFLLKKIKESPSVQKKPYQYYDSDYYDDFGY